MNQEERIEYFMAEIARLSNQVVDLQDERDALAATFDALRKAFPLKVLIGCDGHLNYPVSQYNDVVGAFNSMPQHHLRQVRADAGRDGFIAGYMLCNDGSPLLKHNYKGMADNYHASILAGKE